VLPPEFVRPAAAVWRVGLPPASVLPAMTQHVGDGGRATEGTTCKCPVAGVDETGGECLSAKGTGCVGVLPPAFMR